MKKKIIWISIAVLVVIGFVGWRVYQNAQAPYHQAKDEAEAIAKEYASLKELDEFYWYNGKKTYFSILGSNTNNEKIAVIIAKDNGETHIYQQNEGITEEQAKQVVKDAKDIKKIVKASLGMVDDKPVWEVSYLNKSGSLGYYTISFEDGSILTNIDNL